MNFAENRDFVVNLLQNNVCRISFTKEDGTNRYMTGTLKKSELPPLSNEVQDTAFRKENLEVVRVYDTELSGWRSFRLDRLNYIYEVNDKIKEPEEEIFNTDSPITSESLSDVLQRMANAIKEDDDSPTVVGGGGTFDGGGATASYDAPQGSSPSSSEPETSYESSSSSDSSSSVDNNE